MLGRAAGDQQPVPGQQRHGMADERASVRQVDRVKLNALLRDRDQDIDPDRPRG
jgi:hypothetical protein